MGKWSDQKSQELIDEHPELYYAWAGRVGFLKIGEELNIFCQRKTLTK